MKKIIITITAILFFAVTYATDKVEKNIERSFHSQFPGATHASWLKIKSSDLYTVRFLYSGEALMAYFDTEGNYLAVARRVIFENLPFEVKKSFSKINLSNALTASEEITMMGETSYLFQFKDGGKAKLYRVYQDGGIEKIRIKERVVRN